MIGRFINSNDKIYKLIKIVKIVKIVELYLIVKHL